MAQQQQSDVSTQASAPPTLEGGDPARNAWGPDLRNHRTREEYRPFTRRCTTPVKQKAKSLGQYLSSGTSVILYVGPERTPYTLNEDLLCDKITFFQTAFRGPFSESVGKQMDLPDDDPSVFCYLIDWIYGVPICCKEDHALESSQSLTIEHELLWCKLFVLADKLGIDELSNRALSTFQQCIISCAKTHIVSKIAVDFTYENTLAGSNLRALMGREIVKYYFLHDRTQEAFKNLVRGNDEAQMDVFDNIGWHIQETFCGWRNCYYHSTIVPIQRLGQQQTGFWNRPAAMTAASTW